MLRKPECSPFDRRRWTEGDARVVLSALKRSGKSVSVFAAEQGLDPQRVYAWRRRLGGAEPTTFQELIVRPSGLLSGDGEGASFELVLPSGVLVRVPPRFEPAALAHLLAVLGQGHAC